MSKPKKKKSGGKRKKANKKVRPDIVHHLLLDNSSPPISKPEKPDDVMEVETYNYPYDEELTERSRKQWQQADWQSLSAIDLEMLEHHPDRAKLALLTAAGHMQIGDNSSARQCIRLAKEWGCSKKLISQILISGVYNSLGRASIICGQKQKSIEYLEMAVTMGTPGGNTRLLAQMRFNQIDKSNTPAMGLADVQMLARDRSDVSIGSPSCPLNKIITTDKHRMGISRIVVAGMRHSGSTALFNIIRLSLSQAGIEFVSCYSEMGIPSSENVALGKVSLIKTHEFRDDIASTADLIITARRDLRNTVASAVRREFPLLKRLGTPAEYAKYNRTLHDVWSPLSNYVFVYENYMKDPIVTITNLLHFLGLENIDAFKIYEEILTLPKDQYSITLLSPSHITDPQQKLSFMDSLDEDTIAKINSEHAFWLNRYGYSI